MASRNRLAGGGVDGQAGVHLRPSQCVIPIVIDKLAERARQIIFLFRPPSVTGTRDD